MSARRYESTAFNSTQRKVDTATLIIKEAFLLIRSHNPVRSFTQASPTPTLQSTLKK
jgi:hypothetical protein